MKTVGLNAVAALIALGLSTGAAALTSIDVTRAVNPTEPGAATRKEVEQQADGRRILEDHSGVRVPLREYRRIASGSTLADQILLALCEPARIIAVSGYSARDPSRGFLFSGKARIEDLTNIEAIVSLSPDLLLINNTYDVRLVTRLRDAGIVVYDLGQMLGMKTLLPNIIEVAELVGRRTAGEHLARTLRDRMSKVAIDIPAQKRKRGMYLSTHGGHLFGGAPGTSYHDVISAAGLLDVTASTFRDWPEFSAEQVLELDPDVVVTNSQMGRAVCGHPALGTLRACRGQASFVELDIETLGDPGPRMLDAAEAIRRAVYGGTTQQVLGNSTFQPQHEWKLNP